MLLGHSFCCLIRPADDDDHSRATSTSDQASSRSTPRVAPGPIVLSSELGTPGASMVFRRTADSNVWHFCTNCPEWPQVGDYVEISHIPVAGQMCQDCRENHAENKDKEDHEVDHAHGLSLRAGRMAMELDGGGRPVITVLASHLPRILAELGASSQRLANLRRRSKIGVTQDFRANSASRQTSLTR
jgi:hypothetical protein